MTDRDRQGARSLALDVLEALVAAHGRAEVEAMLAQVAPRKARRQRARRRPLTAGEMAERARQQARRAGGE